MPPEPPPPAAPEFILPMLEGGGVVSLSDLKGKIVILDLWATWCPPCVLQVPVLNAFHEAHRADGDVVVYGISVDQVGVDEIRDWASEHDVRYPNLVGGEALSRELGAVGFPALFVIGPDGLLYERHEGVIERETLEDLVRDEVAVAEVVVRADHHAVLEAGVGEGRLDVLGGEARVVGNRLVERARNLARFLLDDLRLLRLNSRHRTRPEISR